MLTTSDEVDVTNNSNQTITLPKLCALSRDDSSCSSCSTSMPAEFNSLDEWLDAYALADHIRSPNNPAKRRRIDHDDRDMRPMAFIRLNTSLGKPKPVTI